MADYTEDINGAYDDIKEAGRLITIVRETLGVYDPDTRTTAASVSQSMSLYAITPPATQNKISSFESMFVDKDGLVGREVKYVVAAAKDATFKPSSADKVTIDTVVYSVAGLTSLSVNGQDILYKMGVYK